MNKTNLKRPQPAETEHVMAEALENYINPEHPEYDPEFTLKLLRTRPEWFTSYELARLVFYDEVMAEAISDYVEWVKRQRGNNHE